MREKIAELFKEFYDKTFAYYYYHNEANLENVTPDQYADQILALFKEQIDRLVQQNNLLTAQLPSLGGIDHVEKCIVCAGSGEVDDGGSEFRDREFYPCINCNGTGTISRSAKWGDIEIKIAYTGDVVLLDTPYLESKTGSLRVKE